MNSPLHPVLAARLGFVFAAGALCLPQSALATSWKEVFAEEVSFKEQATALTASERDKLHAKLREVQASGGCIEYVLVTGLADEGAEGARSRALAMARAKYVAARISAAGVPSGLVHAAIPTAVLSGCVGSSRACAGIEIQTIRHGAPTCP